MKSQLTESAEVFIILLPWLLLVLQSYIAFTFPIKQDRYKHSFSRHVVHRLDAFVRLLKSPFKFRNLVLPIETIHQSIENTCRKYQVDPFLVEAVVIYESGYNPNARSTTGAMGLMALMPGTARRLGVNDPFDPESNIDGGTRLICELLAQFGEDAALALAGYNAGEEAVKRHKGVPPYRETRDYVQHVSQIHRLCKLAREKTG